MLTHRSIPRSTVIPALAYSNIGEAIDWLCDTFGFILREPTDYPFGERQYTVEDLGGHRWTFSQSIADAAPEEWGGTFGQLT